MVLRKRQLSIRPFANEMQMSFFHLSKSKNNPTPQQRGAVIQQIKPDSQVTKTTSWIVQQGRARVDHPSVVFNYGNRSGALTCTGVACSYLSAAAAAAACGSFPCVCKHNIK